MENRFRIHLIAWVVVACLLLGAIPASALTAGHLEELVSKYAVKTQPLSSAEAKSTTKLSPPKKMAIKVGQIKRLNLKLKYNIQPDDTTIRWDRGDRISVFFIGDSWFVAGLDTGVAIMLAQSGTKTATTRVTVSPMPLTGIGLTADLLTANQFAADNLSRFVDPIFSSSRVKWASDKPSIVKVTANGNITCKKPGDAVITCKTKKGNKLVGSILVVVS